MTHGTDAARVPTSHELILGVGRAFGGSLLFVLPILMTMEMWRFGMVLYAYEVSVTRGLALVSDATYVETMTAINATIRKPSSPRRSSVPSHSASSRLPCPCAARGPPPPR